MSAARSAAALYVNGERVPPELVLDEAERLRAMAQSAGIADPAAREQQFVALALSGAIDRMLIKQEAEKDASPVSDEDVELEMEKLRGGLCAASWDSSTLRVQAAKQAAFTRTAKRLIGTVPPPTPGQVGAFFRSNQKMFQWPDRVESAHIVKFVGQGLIESEAQAEIELAMQEVERGCEFGAVAARISDCPAGGGYVGIFARGQLAPEYEAVVFGMRRGQYSDVFRTAFGFHIAKTLAKHPARAARFDEVEPDIRRMLTAKAEKQAMRKSLDLLRTAARITGDTAA